MSWTPPESLQKMVDLVMVERRERYHATVGPAYEGVDATAADRGVFGSGPHHTMRRDVTNRAFEEYALGTIDEVLALMRDLHGGQIPVDAAPWLRDELLKWIDPLARSIAVQAGEYRRQHGGGPASDRDYPAAAVTSAKRKIELELGKLAYKADLRRLTPPAALSVDIGAGADLFICHASEDKADVARPLADRIVEAGHSVWLDQFEITLGDRLLDKIDEGIASCRFGAVILSPSFFAKKWPRRELAGLAAREDAEDRKLVLPIWHQITSAEITRYSPLMAATLGISTEEGLNAVIDAILRVLRKPT